VTPVKHTGMFPAAAIVILGCKVRPDGSPTAALLRRILLGLKAFEHGLADRIIASGGRRWNHHAEADCIAAELQKRGLSERVIDRELRSQTTAENARFSARRLPHESRILLATCTWHMPRAVRAFERRRLRVVLLPTDWGQSPEASKARRLREFFSQCLDDMLTMDARP
jgi:SanA protein